MARIRTIKPDFWTDETLTECSLSARLLFIGTWNFADDKGNLEHSAKQLKMKIFPADGVKVLPLLNELITHGFLIEYSVSGKMYLHIKGFEKHQVINRPSVSSIPPFDDSLMTPGGLPEDSLREGKGREGKGREETLPSPVGDPPSNGFSPDDMARLWNEGIEFFEKDQAVLIPKILKLTDERKKKASARIKDCRVDETRWRSIINAIHQSDHLSGRKPSKGYENWTASFDFVVRSQTILTKIIEGGYR